jgi:hypothetical protein
MDGNGPILFDGNFRSFSLKSDDVNVQVIELGKSPHKNNRY